MKTLAEEIVSDFGIKDFIDNHLKDCVEKLASYSGDEKVGDTFDFIDGLIRISPSTRDWEKGVKKYSSLLGTRQEIMPLSTVLSGYIYAYILNKASESGIPVNK